MSSVCIVFPFDVHTCCANMFISSVIPISESSINVPHNEVQFKMHTVTYFIVQSVM